MALSAWFPRRFVFRALLPFRALSVGVRGMVQDRDGRILLVRHTYVSGWHFPGGGVSPGETASQAIAREVYEETAIRLTGPAELRGVYLNRRLDARDHVLLFHCRDWERAGEFRPGLEIAEIAFFAMDELPDDLSQGTACRIAEWSQGLPPSEEW